MHSLDATTDLELLERALLEPALRPEPWRFEGREHDPALTVRDLTATRTWASLRVVLGWQRDVTPEVMGVRVHLPELLPLFAASPSRADLDALLSLCRAHGVFDISVDPETGVVRTSGGQENPAMYGNVWVTDSIRTLGLLGSSAERRRVLQTLARFYTSPMEQAAFDACIADPGRYHDDPRKEGVAHIFQVHGAELTRDPRWFNHSRLESHALALRALAEHLRAGGKPWDEGLRAVAHLALYLDALDYPHAPSSGCWEEIPFPGGLTWDTEASRAAFTTLKALRDARPGVWARLLDAARALHPARRSRIETPHGLDELIAEGRARVRSTYLAEAPGFRDMDAALTFVAQSTDLTLHDDPLENALRFEALLLKLEHGLLRGDGMLRYAPSSLVPHGKERLPDSYLACNYWLGFDEEGWLNPPRARIVERFASTDAGEPEVFRLRSALAIPDREAEWFLVSDLSRAWSRQVERVRALPSGEPLRGPMEENARQRAILNLYRALGRIAPGGMKSNGQACPPWKVPEAWEWVRVRGKAVGSDRLWEERTLPGVNTPLAWAQASLLQAMSALREII